MSWKKRHDPKWFIVRDSYIVAVDDPASVRLEILISAVPSLIRLRKHRLKFTKSCSSTLPLKSNVLLECTAKESRCSPVTTLHPKLFPRTIPALAPMDSSPMRRSLKDITERETRTILLRQGKLKVTNRISRTPRIILFTSDRVRGS